MDKVINRDQKIEELMTVFAHFKRHIRREVGQKVDDGMTVTQVELLIAIEQGHSRLRDIADKAYMSPSAVTQQLKALEAAGYIDRHEAERDRRENTLIITKKGRSYLKKRREIIHAHFKQYLKALTSKEIDTFVNIMHKMIEQNKQEK